MLEARSITFQYDGAGEPLLREISVAVAPGDFTMLLGPNGCGKSTVLKLLAGFLAVRSGEVCLDGSDLQRLPPANGPAGSVSCRRKFLRCWISPSKRWS